MKYSTKSATPGTFKTDCLVLSLASARRHTDKADQSLLDAALVDFKDKPGQTLVVRLPADRPVRRLLIAGGADDALSAADYLKVCQSVATALKSVPATAAAWALGDTRVEGGDVHWRYATALTALSRAFYQFDAHKAKDKPAPLTLRSIAVTANARQKSAAQQAVREANALKAGMDLCRDLGNQPPNVCNPNYLLKEARKLGKDPQVSVSALDEKRMTELGMGAFMSVTQGSDTPGRMIIIQYRGAAATQKPVALVGKGITFDTGGISLKPGPAMDEMKFDMCGAAAVLGVTRAVIEAKLKINLVTVLAAAENMPSGRASRPGDIVSTLSGQTVEILNTDAEGRLVLCDALTYVGRYKPRAVIDVATLTGACIVALGSHASGLFANSDELADALLKAGEWSQDRAWRLPVWEDYQASLKSNFADMANIGGRDAGAITAACFLARFTRDYQWAHLDVAGSAFQGGASKGATGRPVALLFRYLAEAVQ